MTSKELQKMIDTTRRDIGREHGFRQSSYINFKVENGYFFCLYFSLEKARLEVKPMYADDLWWEIWEAKENKREPLSLRGKGTYALSGQVLTDIAVFGDRHDFDNIDIRQFYERVFNEANTEIERFLLLNPDADSFVPDESRMYHDPDRLLYLMALVHSGNNQEVLSIIKEARQNKHRCEFRSGLFEDSYTHIRRWCKRDGFFNNIGRSIPNLINLIVRTKTFAVMSMGFNVSNHNKLYNPSIGRIFEGSILLALITSSLYLFDSYNLAWIIVALYIVRFFILLINRSDKKELRYEAEYMSLPITNKRKFKIISWVIVILLYLYSFCVILYATKD